MSSGEFKRYSSQFELSNSSSYCSKKVIFLLGDPMSFSSTNLFLSNRDTINNMGHGCKNSSLRPQLYLSLESFQYVRNFSMYRYYTEIYRYFIKYTDIFATVYWYGKIWKEIEKIVNHFVYVLGFFCRKPALNCCYPNERVNYSVWMCFVHVSKQCNGMLFRAIWKKHSLLSF